MQYYINQSAVKVSANLLSTKDGMLTVFSRAFRFLFLFFLKLPFPPRPHKEVTEGGDIVYHEVVRENIRKLEAYMEEMATYGPLPTAVNIDNMQEDVLELWNVVKSQPEISQEQKNRIKALYDGVL